MYLGESNIGSQLLDSITPPWVHNPAIGPNRKGNKKGTCHTGERTTGRGAEGLAEKTSWQKQRSTKETLHTSESRKECSKQAGMRIPTDRGPLALKTLLAVQFKWIKILNLTM